MKGKMGGKGQTHEGSLSKSKGSAPSSGGSPVVRHSGGSFNSKHDMRRSGGWDGRKHIAGCKDYV